MNIAGVEIVGTAPHDPAVAERLLTPEALAFLAGLERTFGARRRELLQERERIQAEIDAGRLPTFRADTAHIRQEDWQVAPAPADLQKRWVEITGPTDRKMMINALNSGADVFMADFEDANSPTWRNMLEGQLNLCDAVRRTISFTTSEGRAYELQDKIATLLVRPRGWHLEEKHLLVDGRAMSASLFDFGLYFFHNARELLERGSGPYFYLAKLENAQEARLWNDVFIYAQDELDIPQGSVRATVLIENILAAFEMEEILYQLREHAAGLNAGRWDYIFSVIKKFRNQPDFLLPNRAQITMTVPFMHAYSELLVQTCHKRGAHAIGGMAAYIPRKDPAANELAFQKVRADKERESAAGFDGAWIAHPGLEPVVREIFAAALGDRPHQKDRLRPDVNVTAEALLDFTVRDGFIDEEGLRTNINVSLLYLASWLNGVGAAALYDLMEDTATAEISRAQVWQWINHPAAALRDGRKVTLDLVRQMLPEELAKIEQLVGHEPFSRGQYDLAARLFDQLVAAEEFVGFLTLPAYKHLD